MIAYQHESFDDVIEEALPILEKQYREISHYQDVPLEIDREMYSGLDDCGFLRVFTARLSGALIGYGTFFVRSNLHYMSSKQAVQDIFYIAEDYRKSGVGRDLVIYAENYLREEGVHLIYHHVKKNHPALGVLLEKQGYELIDLVYGKKIKEV